MNCAFIKETSSLVSAINRRSTMFLIKSSLMYSNLYLRVSVKYFTDRSKAVLLLWIFYVFVLSCVCYVLCASVYMCFVVTCWERADLLALVCGVFCEFVTFPLVSWVRCGTWLYRFLIFAPLLTFIIRQSQINHLLCFRLAKVSCSKILQSTESWISQTEEISLSKNHSEK